MLRLRGYAALAAAAVALGTLAVVVSARGDRATEPPIGRTAGPGIVPFPNVGSQARDFTLPLLASGEPWIAGDRVTLSDLRGRYVYLDVFGTWCEPCREKYPEMREVAREVQAAGGAVIGLLLEDRPADAAAWFSAHGGTAYPFAILDDETARAWRLVGAPMGFLLDPDGRIVRKCAGCATEEHRVEGLPREIRRLARASSVR